jgi:hypothetical protein
MVAWILVEYGLRVEVFLGFLVLRRAGKHHLSASRPDSERFSRSQRNKMLRPAGALQTAVPRKGLGYAKMRPISGASLRAFGGAPSRFQF